MEFSEAGRPSPSAQPLVFRVEGRWLAASISTPAASRGLVMVARAGGGDGLALRNHRLARMLETAGIGTLLVDLMTPEEQREESERARRSFDVELLARRLGACTEAARSRGVANGAPIGYFGEGTAASAALAAAVDDPSIAAVVSRAGLPHLVASTSLARLRAPTLFLVGAAAKRLIEVSRAACHAIRGPARVALVEGTRYGLAPARAQAEFAWRALDWFRHHLGDRPVATPRAWIGS